MKHWSSAYIGLPYADLGRSAAGVDCWGLAHLIFAEVAGIDLASYSEEYLGWQERTEINGLINEAKTGSFWREVDRSQALDLVVFRAGRLDTHIGVVVRPGLMLHVIDQRPSCIETYREGPWSSRLTGTWRHAQMEDRLL